MNELRSVTVTHLTDPAAVGESITVLNYNVVNLDPDQFAVSRITVPFENSCLVYISTTAPLRTRTFTHAGMDGVFNLGPRSRGSVNGMKLQPCVLLSAGPGMNAEVVVEKNYESMAILLPAGEIERHLRARRLQSEFEIPTGIRLWQPDTQTARAHFRLGKQMARIAERTPGLFNDNPSARIGAGVEYLESLLDTIETCTSRIETESDKVGRNYSQIVKICEEYTLEQEDCRPHLSELCAVTGVSRKTLHNAFRHIMGMSPVMYLNRLRLHRSREDLRVAFRDHETVTDVALRWGFWHLGEYSRMYKQCFGELPSQTLRSNA